MAGPETGPAAVAPRRGSLRRLVLGLALLALFFALKMWVVEPAFVSQVSMRPTLDDGNALVIDKLSYQFRDPRIGEIVTARLPDTGESVVKRVVAVGGDSIGFYDGTMLLNDEPVDDSYALRKDMQGYFWGPITVPEGYVFLLGDNYQESTDSRTYGPLPVDSVDGRLLVRFWPF
ncbi:MAG: signal peptidase I [Actinomycetota bacterium]